ncbi:MAG TPA: DUF3037 domain-containing protein [Sporichthya sp.]|nr:DUF3037 domain-containing protein [Sporichthya sp.]
MTTRQPFEYALLRLVPRVERGEAINGGVLLYCRALDYLAADTHLDPERLRALDPQADVTAIERALTAAGDVCAGAPNSGPVGAEDLGKRFRWLTAPRSTVVQPGPVHTGLTLDPASDLARLMRTLVYPAP